MSGYVVILRGGSSLNVIVMLGVQNSIGRCSPRPIICCLLHVVFYLVPLLLHTTIQE